MFRSWPLVAQKRYLGHSIAPALTTGSDRTVPLQMLAEVHRQHRFTMPGPPENQRNWPVECSQA